MPHRINPDDERALLARLDSDPAAFNSLYTLYLSRVYSYVAARIENQQDAEDVVSEVFLKVLKNLGQFRYQHGLSFAAWIFTIARHAVSDFYRRRPPDQTLSLQAAPLATETPPDLALIEREGARDLRRLVAALPERRRDVVMLKFFSGLRNQEIAVVLGIGEKSVAANLSRALKDLSQQVQPAEKQVNRDAE